MSQLRLPNSLSDFPFPRCINPHYAPVKAETEEWLRGMKVLDPSVQESFEKCDFVLLTAHFYPSLTLDQFRVASKMHMFLFVIDEYTDQADSQGVQVYIHMVVDALERPHVIVPVEDGQCNLREMARQFWQDALAVAPSAYAAQRRFKANMISYMNAVANEADDRAQGTIRSIDAFLEFRRQTAGGYPTLFPMDFCFDIPDEVMQHPTMCAFNDMFADSIFLTNDLYSYNVEQASGFDTQNLVTVVMNEQHVSAQDAMDWVGHYNAQLVGRYAALKADLPSWGPVVDRDVEAYVTSIGHGIRGVDAWSFESERYFGPGGLEVQRTRVMTLLPNIEADVATPLMVMDAVGKRTAAEAGSLP
ncbi:isoprenoid synthase domain-containing protein [Vararia minispora EC-137]|uniref:Isoprenoid synthase domain-containing protein n=1 Tax=Vararia minispora EC-137 TaxID=1314806 RepID=A0ACB8QIZ9_9AGAM|nr:isoprenoid synthase domain-containing protein [Vararia minispora EC-137]